MSYLFDLQERNQHTTEIGDMKSKLVDIEYQLKLANDLNQRLQNDVDDQKQK